MIRNNWTKKIGLVPQPQDLSHPDIEVTKATFIISPFGTLPNFELRSYLAGVTAA